MDLNFPLILVVLVFGCFIVWGIDVLLFAGKRKASVAALQQRYPKWQQVGSEDEAQYQAELAQQKEPVLVENAKSFGPVLALVLVVRSFLVEPFQIPSSSMVPTLLVGDFILVNKYAYGIRLPVLDKKIIDIGEPKRGDVMVFYPPNDPRYFIKRVIGLPGDKIHYSNKTLTVNGKKVEQTLIAELPPGRATYRLAKEQLDEAVFDIRIELLAYRPRIDEYQGTVPAGHYFVMGDNRDNSSDSRDWGFVPEDNVVGKAVAKWMHWDSFFSLPSFKRVGLIE